MHDRSRRVPLKDWKAGKKCRKYFCVRFVFRKMKLVEVIGKVLSVPGWKRTALIYAAANVLQCFVQFQCLKATTQCIFHAF